MPPDWVHTKNPFRFQMINYKAKQCHTRQLNHKKVLFQKPRNNYLSPKIPCTPKRTKTQQKAHPLSKFKKHQNFNKLAKKLAALGFRAIVEFEPFFEANEP